MSIALENEDRQAEYVGRHGEYYGINVLLAMRGQDVEAVEVASVELSLGRHLDASLRTWLRARLYQASVFTEGSTIICRLVKLGDFFHFCMMNPTERLTEFRDALAKMAKSVTNRGSYIDPVAGAGARLKPGEEADPLMATLATVMDVRSRQLSLESRVKQLDGDVASVKAALGQGPSAWTVAAWLKYQIPHRTFAIDILKSEGGRLRRICDQRGIVVSGQKVCMGSDYPATMWPREAIDIWWPDFRNRFGV